MVQWTTNSSIEQIIYYFINRKWTENTNYQNKKKIFFNDVFKTCLWYHVKSRAQKSMVKRRFSLMMLSNIVYDTMLNLEPKNQWW